MTVTTLVTKICPNELNENEVKVMKVLVGKRDNRLIRNADRRFDREQGRR